MPGVIRHVADSLKTHQPFDFFSETVGLGSSAGGNCTAIRYLYRKKFRQALLAR
jgi:hypothetical protein